MPPIDLGRRARADLDHIYDYGVAQFGRAVADRTADALTRTINRLVETPVIGTPVDGRADGMRRIACGVHVVFFVPEAHRVHVVRVLDARMDAGQHL